MVLLFKQDFALLYLYFSYLSYCGIYDHALSALVPARITFTPGVNVGPQYPPITYLLVSSSKQLDAFRPG
jgi:hypothetical protein